MRMCLAVSSQYRRVTDGRRDGRTDRQTDRHLARLSALCAVKTTGAMPKKFSSGTAFFAAIAWALLSLHVIFKKKSDTDPDHCYCCCCDRETVSLRILCLLRGTVVERRSLTSKLSLSCARPIADGWPLMWVNRRLYVSQPGQVGLSSFRGT